jgi:DNA-binding NtrC family response regulator
LDAVSSAQPEEKDEEEEQTSKLDIESSNYRLIVSSLQQSGGNIKRAAEILGISRRTLYRKMDKFNIDLNEFRN